MKKALYGILILFLVALAVAVYFLDAAMPIGSGYSAKYVCSQVFLADRDPKVVFENDVKPTNILFTTISNTVDYDQKIVTSAGFGFWRPAFAVYREGFGCTLAVDVTREELLTQAKGARPQPKPDQQKEWPFGERVDFDNIPADINKDKLSQAVEEAFQEPGETSMRNTQAVVIVYKGKLVAEKYTEQFSPKTPMLGWSMSKTITNGLTGVMVEKGKLDIHQPAPVKIWKKNTDPRSKITLDHLLRMSSGLDFEEEYAPLKDATYMLYDSKSMADYAADKPLRAKPDGEWYYSSGTTNIIARIIKDAAGGSLVSFNDFARTQLFDKLQMYSAIIEPDASGSFVGSSYMFATPRDWARYGLFLLNDGVWNGERILPEGWVSYSTTPTPLAPKGEYGAQIWLNAGEKGNINNRDFPSLPNDMFYLSGFNGQIVAIIPSKNLIVVRIGATHNSSDWNVEEFIGNVLSSIKS
ncbi:beta-lactamase family protein [bacterium]|nr:beta-lactamase family protein [bacterium]